MNGKKARGIRKFFGDDKSSARRARLDASRIQTSLAQRPKNIGAGPIVPTGRTGNGMPTATAPQDKPLRAIFSIAKEQGKTARILIANAMWPSKYGRDPIKYLAHGPRTRVNAVLQQLRAA